LKTAILLNIPLETFEEMTPYELALYAETFIEMKTQELEEKITLVWLHEYYHRQKHLPSLKDEIKKMTGKNKEMTDEEMLETVRLLNAQFGGSVITKDGENNG
jgi:hypothetical protein